MSERVVLVLESAGETLGRPWRHGVWADSVAGRAAARAHIGSQRLAWRPYAAEANLGQVIAVAVPPGTPRDGEDDLRLADRWVLRVEVQ